MGESTTAKDISNAGEKRSDSSNRELLKEIEKRIEAGFSKFLIIFSLLLFVATFIWVIFAAIFWPAENEKYFRIPLKGDGKRQLEVWGPAIVPGDEAFVEIQFTSHQESVSNTPLSLSVTIPEEFIILSPTSGQYAHKVNIQFDGMLADETRTLKVANAHIVQNLGVGMQDVKISIEGQTTELDFFPLGAEGTWRTVLRQYGGGGSEFPFFPLTTLFVSVTGWAYREIQQRIQAKEKELEQQRDTAKSQIKNVRSAIKDGQIDLARQTLDELSQGELKQFTNANDLQTAGRLIRIGLNVLICEKIIKGRSNLPNKWKMPSSDGQKKKKKMRISCPPPGATPLPAMNAPCGAIMRVFFLDRMFSKHSVGWKWQHRNWRNFFNFHNTNFLSQSAQKLVFWNTPPKINCGGSLHFTITTLGTAMPC